MRLSRSLGNKRRATAPVPRNTLSLVVSSKCQADSVTAEEKAIVVRWYDPKPDGIGGGWEFDVQHDDAIPGCKEPHPAPAGR